MWFVAYFRLSPIDHSPLAFATGKTVDFELFIDTHGEKIDSIFLDVALVDTLVEIN